MDLALNNWLICQEITFYNPITELGLNIAMEFLNFGSNILQNSSCTAIYFPSQKASTKDERDIRGTTGEVKTNS